MSGGAKPARGWRRERYETRLRGMRRPDWAAGDGAAASHLLERMPPAVISAAVSALGGPNGSGEKPFRLTAETREALRRAIDRRRRELLAERPAVDRELFADEAVTA